MVNDFLQKMQQYGRLSDEGANALGAITRERVIQRHDYFLHEGGFPKTVAFVASGLFSQYYISADGEVVIKKFFCERNFMASLSALITGTPSIFTIKALEKSVIVEFGFAQFKELSKQYPDLSQLYINYLEQHWVVEKEPLEISYRHDDAATRYRNFLAAYPGLETRIKQHEVASYLGITPTQLSRIRAEATQL
jgi:CRP-like cAMP-binding protein